MRPALSALCLALTALLAAACGGDRSEGQAAQGNFSLEAARAFTEFHLYAPGESYGDLPLTAVLRAFDPSSDAPPVRANYVDFIYGTCEPTEGSEGGCTPPLTVQVWAACERNPMVYGAEAGQERPIEVRGVPAYFYEGGRRLELSTGTSTVVIFASGREAALAAATALRGINNPVVPGQPLPEPAYTRAEGGVVSVIPCAYEDPTQLIDQDPVAADRVEEELQKELDAGAAQGDNLPVGQIACFRSPVPTRVGSLTDAHQCEIGWEDGSFVTWCVLSSETEVLRGTVPKTCEEAAGGSETFIPTVDPASNAALRWGAHAAEACGPWREREMNAIAALDQDVVVEDLSYVWFAMRPFEAGLVRDLRVIPDRAGAARKAVALYERRLAAIDAGLAAWNEGRKDRALVLFSRAERVSPRLTALFGVLRADVCAPF